jgi:enoyl-CoA hydratase/carnithine racemase
MADVAALTIDPARLLPGEEPWDGPLAFVRLGEGTVEAGAILLPPCPVIGIGDSDDPLAAALDAVIEPPVSAQAIAAQVLRRPRTAAVIVDLLRLLPRLTPADGLIAESLAYGLLQGSAEHAEWLKEPRPEALPPGAVQLARDGGRLSITLDRPHAGNAIDRPMRDALHEAFALVALDPRIDTVCLSASSRAFSLGADLAEFGTTRDPATAHAIRARTLPARMIARCAGKLEAHVQGACVGAGLEMAAFARRLTATRGAWFQLPELAMGVLPGAGGCVSLSRRIGRQRTALMILSGKRISAEVALRWGLVDALVDDLAGDDGHPYV